MPPTPSPTDERLRDYIAKRMRMSHVVQPLMLMELLGRRSPAPAQDVARRILGEDVTQIDDYTERVKRMVGKVLTGNGITRYDQGAYDLVGGEELSDAERDQLLQLCRQRLDAFRMQRGEEVFAHCSRHRVISLIEIILMYSQLYHVCFRINKDAGNLIGCTLGQGAYTFF